MEKDYSGLFKLILFKGLNRLNSVSETNAINTTTKVKPVTKIAAIKKSKKAASLAA